MTSCAGQLELGQDFPNPESSVGLARIAIAELKPNLDGRAHSLSKFTSIGALVLGPCLGAHSKWAKDKVLGLTLNGSCLKNLWPRTKLSLKWRVLSSTRVSSSGSGASADASSTFAQPAGMSVALLQPPVDVAAHSGQDCKGSQCGSRGVELESFASNSLSKASSFDPLVPTTSHWIYELKRRPRWW